MNLLRRTLLVARTRGDETDNPLGVAWRTDIPRDAWTQCQERCYDPVRVPQLRVLWPKRRLNVLIPDIVSLGLAVKQSTVDLNAGTCMYTIEPLRI